MKRDDLEIVFLKTIADPTRMAILYYLKGGEKSFKQVMQHISKSQSITSTSLKALRQESLVQSRTEHGQKYFSIRTPSLFLLLQQITNFVTEKEQMRILARSKSESSDIL